MFTGLVSDVGEVLENRKGNGGYWLKIGCHYDPDTIALGASIACSGICLSVTAKGGRKGEAWFSVDASYETASLTALKGWGPKRRINLERAMRLGDELGGHMVSGHIDGTARIVGRKPDGSSLCLRFDVSRGLSRFIAAKGSIALDGTSLTVNRVEGSCFTVNLIPHTLETTTWGEARCGDEVNIEIDMLARYVARLNDMHNARDSTFPATA
ncbi:MAG: riboflavin synthase [Hyphomicrobiales bacterium]